MSHKCGKSGCGTHTAHAGCGTHTSNENCDHQQLTEEELEEILKEKKEHSRNYTVEYRISLQEMECEAEELIERVEGYMGLIDEVEFTEEELIICYDDRLITPAEISDLVQ